LITDHVAEEVSYNYPEQRLVLEKALSLEILEIIVINEFEEIQIFNTLVKDGRLGAGECSAIACAIHRGLTLAIDDISALKQAEKIAPDLMIVNTLMIMFKLINLNVIEPQEAEKIRIEWKWKHKFGLNVEFDSLR
jgi:predicted nucleic acid-binding protein